VHNCTTERTTPNTALDFSLESRASEEIVTVVEEAFASLLGQAPAIEIEPAEISDQIPVPLLVVCLVRPRQPQIQVRQSDRPVRVYEAVRAYNIEPRKTGDRVQTEIRHTICGGFFAECLYWTLCGPGHPLRS
jgi:hypothetical protein